MSTNELTSKIKELRELQALIEEAQAEAEAIKDALKAHMGDAEELRAGEYKGYLEDRDHRQTGRQGPQGGSPRCRRSIHQRDHQPPLCRGMRKAPYPTSRPKRLDMKP